VSAILGILHLGSQRVEPTLLERMLDTLSHRGPDGAELWSEGNIGFGHQMLHTTPESLHEKLPLANRRGNLVLTADARIDNRDELITALNLAERAPVEISDSELILYAYEKWGESCTERLVGDFAFAIWDRKKQTLFCARDRIGVKPLYYYRSGRIFVFASEIKAMLCVPEVPHRLNELKVAEYLATIEEDKSITFYWDVSQLLPGHSMTVGPRGTSTRQYWSLDPSREVKLGSDEEYAETFRELFTEAVRCRLRSAFEVGSQLSGGLDSSSIVCTARELLTAEDTPRRLHTFSAIYDDVPGGDERAFMHEVIKGGLLEPHFLQADQVGPLADLKRMMWHLDEPFLSGVFVNWELQRLAHEQGVRVVLTGIDGDTVVSRGDSYLIELAQSGRWWTLAAEIGALSAVLGRSRQRTLRRAVIEPLAPERVVRVWRWLRRRPQSKAPPGATETFLRPDFARSVGLQEHIESLRQKPPTGAVRTSRLAHWRGLTSATWPYLFELDDGVSGAFATENRHPFFDHRLVEFCLAIPPDQKLSQGRSRAVLRRAMAGTLPEKIRLRNNKGASQDYAWARSLLLFNSELLEQLILTDSQVIQKYVDTRVMRETYKRFVSEGSPRDFHIVIMAAHLAFWLCRTELA
jgi:asparagine synthase (glutamine-hydrolysing)